MAFRGAGFDRDRPVIFAVLVAGCFPAGSAGVAGGAAFVGLNLPALGFDFDVGAVEVVFAPAVVVVDTPRRAHIAVGFGHRLVLTRAGLGDGAFSCLSSGFDLFAGKAGLVELGRRGLFFFEVLAVAGAGGAAAAPGAGERERVD